MRFVSCFIISYASLFYFVQVHRFIGHFLAIRRFLDMLIVQKFKRRNRYLEFLVQVVQKAITEGFSELAIDWCEDAITWINKCVLIHSLIHRVRLKRFILIL